MSRYDTRHDQLFCRATSERDGVEHLVRVVLEELVLVKEVVDHAAEDHALPRVAA